ncbi:MAG: 1-phosphofructokinase [Clostridia bacterium]|jgi:1-phosphofructokinase|uniref:1-phosphofructokinase n=1 Tax=Candidatus Merdicola sp. TaxID=3085652 RepID=UPI000967C793|nr:1-phosphofructokinase [Clostridium sp.]MEE0269735.1 1-phosphofructokinase [Clostridia bacterium]OKZ60793.1 MAG: 1-phosphofructokinase [Clostridium sp. CAG:354_28_25]
MIYTVTFNPALDYILELDKLEIGKIQKSKTELILPGGKGINVSTVLTNLEIDNIALGYKAGFVGAELERLLRNMKVKTDFIDLEEGNSRINVKISGEEETAINTNGPQISENKILELLEKLKTLNENDYLVLSGSIPSSIKDDIYEKICSIVKKQNVKIVVDATKNLLVQALKYNPFLIKPNNEELGEIFGVEIHTKEDAYVYGKKLKEMGAQNVLVSMGKIGAALIDEAGQEYFIKSPEGKRVNTVGSGDSMVAGFIAGFLKYNNYNDALRMGVSAGSASALSKYLATKEEVYNLFNNI